MTTPPTLAYRTVTLWQEHRASPWLAITAEPADPGLVDVPPPNVGWRLPGPPPDVDEYPADRSPSLVPGNFALDAVTLVIDNWWPVPDSLEQVDLDRWQAVATYDAATGLVTITSPRAHMCANARTYLTPPAMDDPEPVTRDLLARHLIEGERAEVWGHAWEAVEARVWEQLAAAWQAHGYRAALVPTLVHADFAQARNYDAYANPQPAPVEVDQVHAEAARHVDLAAALAPYGITITTPTGGAQ